MTSNIQATGRTSNLELYRLLLIILIIGNHYVVNSGLIESMDFLPLSVNKIFFNFLGMWGKTCINCFVFITGYYMCKKDISMEKFYRLLFCVLFYDIVIYIIFCLTGQTTFSIKNIFLQALHYDDLRNGYFSSQYLIYYLIIPFINQLVRNLTQEMHKKLIILLVVIFVVIPFIPTYQVMINYVVWFTILHIIASYFRLHWSEERIESTRWGLYALIMIALSMSSVLAILIANNYLGINPSPYRFMVDCNAPFALLTSITLFFTFKNMKIRQSAFVNQTAGCIFGVLLIHANSNVMRSWLWRDVVDCIGHYNDRFFFLYAIGAILCVLIVCTIIELIRKNTIEKWVFKM